MPTRKKFKWHVFVSHNEKQKPWVREIVDQWKGLGLEVFFDEDSIELGGNIIDSIEQGIQNSQYIVLIITPSSVAAPWVALETAIAIYRDPSARAKKIIPVLLEKTDPESIKLSIRILRRADLTDPDQRRKNYHRLLRALGVTRRVLPDPPAWPDNQLSRSFQLAKGGKAFAIGAHWDDILLGCFGTLLKLKHLYNYEVTLFIVCTSYGKKYYGVEQPGLDQKVESIIKTICKRSGFECHFTPEVITQKIEDRRFRDSSTELHVLMRDLAHKYEDHNLIFTPPIDDGHEDHSFTGQLTFSYFRRTYQTILEYEVKKYTERWFVPNIFVSLDEQVRDSSGKNARIADIKTNLLSEVVVKSKHKIVGSEFLFGGESLKAKLITKALNYSGNKSIKYGEVFRGRISI